MADQTTDKTDAPAPAVTAQDAPAPVIAAAEPELSGKPTAEAAQDDAKVPEDPKVPESDEEPATTDAIAEPEPEKKPDVDTDVAMKDAAEAPAASEPAAPAAVATSAETPTAKGKGGRRKSAAGEAKGKTLSKKASKARLTHTDAKPGDHFLVKLKGFPAWPAIISEESMLPTALTNSRPVTAPRPDGSYTEAYADGGKRVNDRSFPVMYLSTNEFGWVSNTALTELTPEKAQDTISEKMRKDLKAAFELAIQHNSIDHYKEEIERIITERAQQEADRLAASTPKAKKGKSKIAEDEDVTMADAEEGTKSAKSKKRKAEDDTSTPQRSDSVKKPKIKLNTSSTPKTANGTPKAKVDSASKPPKSKAKKTKEAGDKKVDPPKEVKQTPEEKLNRKEKEVLYLRHKLQRGLLTRDQQPQEGEMKQMSEFITMLENFADLEVSIIRVTKINKVLKAILKLDSIPREDEFQFKKRSQVLLDNWNKLIASDTSPSAATNGVNGTSDTHAAEKKTEPNGIKESVEGKTDTPASTEGAVADGEKGTTAEVKEKPSTEEKSEEKSEETSEKVDSEAPAAAPAVEAGT